MKIDKMTKKKLAEVAEHLNDILGLDPEIETGADEEELREKITEAMELFTEEEIENGKTEFGDEISKVVVALWEEFRGREKNIDIQQKEISKKQDKLKKQKEKEVKNKKYTRAQAFCDALKGMPKNVTEIAKITKTLYTKANPNKKQPQLSSIKWAVHDYLQPLIILRFVGEKEGRKFFLKKEM